MFADDCLGRSLWCGQGFRGGGGGGGGGFRGGGRLLIVVVMCLDGVSLVVALFFLEKLSIAMSVIMAVCMMDGVRAPVRVVFVVGIVFVANMNFISVVIGAEIEGVVTQVENVAATPLAVVGEESAPLAVICVRPASFGMVREEATSSVNVTLSPEVCGELSTQYIHYSGRR